MPKRYPLRQKRPWQEKCVFRGELTTVHFTLDTLCDVWYQSEVVDAP